MFKFAETVFDDLVSVIAFEIVKNDWECASCEVKFSVAGMTESAAKLASDVIVVAYFLVFFFIKWCFAAWTMCACIEFLLLL